MATFDWVVVALLALSLLVGAWRGLVYEVLSVLSWIAAFVVAQWLANGPTRTRVRLPSLVSATWA